MSSSSTQRTVRTECPCGIHRNDCEYHAPLLRREATADGEYVRTYLGDVLLDEEPIEAWEIRS